MAIRTTSLAIGALALALGCTATAAQVPENDLKAAFVFNFAAFIDWPEGIRPGERLVLCDAAAPGLSRALAGLEGKSVHGHLVEHRRIRGWNQVDGCHALVLARGGLGSGTDSDSADADAATRGVGAGAPPGSHARGLLTVAEDGEAGRNGAVITLVRDGSRIRFDVDTAAAAQAEVTLSSKLMRLARRVL